MSREETVKPKDLIYYPMDGDGPPAGARYRNRHTGEEVVILGHIRRRVTWIAYSYYRLRLQLPLTEFVKHWERM